MDSPRNPGEWQPGRGRNGEEGIPGAAIRVYRDTFDYLQHTVRESSRRQAMSNLSSRVFMVMAMRAAAVIQ
ncbi:hypothetical protein HJFPF1_01511 [Paramyrothecium foliicola]|nr:hypothetical protein HJFPF1_01511 [Paramyrothecium foliicola]